MSEKRRWDRARSPRWGFAPPAPKNPKYEQLRVVGKKIAHMRIVSARAETVATHFIDGRTTFCTQSETQPCDHDHALIGSGTFGGWVAVVIEGSDAIWLFRFTMVAAAVEKRLLDPNLNLRGLRLTAWRKKDCERSELHCRLHVDEPRAVDVPPEIDVRYAVQRMMAACDRAPGNRKEPGMMERSRQPQKGAKS